MMVVWLGLACPPASAFTQRKMLCSRPAENGSVRDRFSIVTRSASIAFPHAGLIGISCPCLTCSIKITQVGISEVVYSQSYGMDLEVKEPKDQAERFQT